MILDQWAALDRAIVNCRRCPRLREHCRAVAQTRRRAYAGERYWARPVTGFGDRNARIWIIGLAPGAHGANRTGRVFTGDRSGDFLYAALSRAGLANQPISRSIDDGLRLTHVYISASARCAPPDNKPDLIELMNCSSFLDREWELLCNKRVLFALGKIAWDSALKLARRHGHFNDQAICDFAHGARLQSSQGALTLIGSYHVSQQNTFTGKLTPEMFDRVIALAQRAAG